MWVLSYGVWEYDGLGLTVEGIGEWSFEGLRVLGSGVVILRLRDMSTPPYLTSRLHAPVSFPT